MNTNITYLSVGKIQITVTRKNIKNLHLAVYPPNGKVKISSPQNMNDDSIRLFAISKLSWIKKQQKKIQSQERQTVREYISGESHYFQGKRYLLKIIYKSKPPRIKITNNKFITLTVRPKSSLEKKRSIFHEWYRQNLRKTITNLLNKWNKRIGIIPTDWSIRLMKTRWGTCNIKKRRILLNLELAKKSIRCAEYVLVHELIHLLEKNHTKKFIGYMDKFLPQWRILRDELNSAPLAHEDWKI